MKSYDALFSHLTYLVLTALPCKIGNQKDSARTGALCVQHRTLSPTAAVLSTLFHLNHASNSPYS